MANPFDMSAPIAPMIDPFAALAGPSAPRSDPSVTAINPFSYDVPLSAAPTAADQGISPSIFASLPDTSYNNDYYNDTSDSEAEWGVPRKSPTPEPTKRGRPSLASLRDTASATSEQVVKVKREPEYDEAGNVVPRKRGRPKKDLKPQLDEDGEPIIPAKRPMGRPRKHPVEVDDNGEPIKRSVGRPRKTVKEEARDEKRLGGEGIDEPERRKRGWPKGKPRPSKVKVETAEDKDDSLPDESSYPEYPDEVSGPIKTDTYIDPRADTTLPRPLPAESALSKCSSAHPTATLIAHGLPEVTTTYDEKWVYLYFRFCAERHCMWTKRAAGLSRKQQTDDECMQNVFVGNIFRELDPSGERHRKLVTANGSDSNEELCFRTFLFTAFYLEGTWQALVDGLGETPSWEKFSLERYEDILYEYHITNKHPIYYGGFQMVPPKSQFGLQMPSYSASLRMVMSMMEMGLPARLAECKYAVDASESIQTIPTFGGFLSLCLLCFLQETSTLKFYLRNFATCGPGSRGFLQRIFGKDVINHVAYEQAGLRWLYENQWRYWARLGVDPPHAHELGLRPGMRVLDIENALCWCHRYVNELHKHKSLANLPVPTYDPELTESTGPPAWCDEEQYVSSHSRPSYAGDYEEEQAKLGRIDNEANEEIYEVEKIVNRKGNRSDKDGLFRVRGKGYPPEEDTWERESSLKDGSVEVLEEWYDWEDRVYETIERIKRALPYKPRRGERVIRTGAMQQRERRARGREMKSRSGSMGEDNHGERAPSARQKGKSGPRRNPRPARGTAVQPIDLDQDDEEMDDEMNEEELKRLAEMLPNPYTEEEAVR